MCIERLVSTFPKCRLSLLPNDKLIDWSKFKAFSDNKLDSIVETGLRQGRKQAEKGEKFRPSKAENMVGGENDGFSAFSPFPTMFSKLHYVGSH